VQVSKSAGAIIGECLLDLCFGIHHQRSSEYHWFAQGSSRNGSAAASTTCLSANRVARVSAFGDDFPLDCLPALTRLS
jgi:hypothetical protein